MNPLVDHIDRLYSDDDAANLGQRSFFFHDVDEDENEMRNPFSWYFPLREKDKNFGHEITRYTTYREICLDFIEEEFESAGVSLNMFLNIYNKTKKLLTKIPAFRIYIYDLCSAFFELSGGREEFSGGTSGTGIFMSKLVKLFAPLIAESSELRLLTFDFTTEDNIAKFLRNVEDLYFSELKKTLSFLRDYDTKDSLYKFIREPLTEFISEYSSVNYQDDDSINFENFGADAKTTTLFVTLSAPLSIRGKPITPSDQILFFNRIRCNKLVPYASAVYPNDERVIMVFSSTDQDKDLPYRKISKSKKRNERPNVIELSVRIPIEATNRSSVYYPAVIDFETGKVQIRVQSVIHDLYQGDIDTIFSHLGDEIEAGKFEEISTSSQILMTMPDDFVFKDYLFHHLVLTNPLFRHTLYYHERVMPTSKRKGVKFYCVPFGGQMFRNEKGNLSVNPIAVSLSVFEQTDIDGKQTIRLRLFLSKVNQGIDFVTMEITNCLLYYYIGLKYGNLDVPGMPQALKEIWQIESRYRNNGLLSETTEIKKTVASRRATAKKNDLQTLQQNYPHVFGANYLSSCRKKAIPSVFLSRDIAEKELREQVFYTTLATTPEPIPFPNAENPEFWIVSLNGKYPHIIMVPNQDEKTQISYPFVPCASDKLPRQLKTELKKTREYVQTVDKFLEPGGFRQGNEALITLFGIDFLHSYGVNYHDKNQKSSLLHCFLFACDYEYRRLFVGKGLEADISKSNDLREKYVSNVRKKHKFDGNLCKQELYNHGSDKIREMFADDKIFLDSSLFYRILEEYSDEKINVFVFTNEKDENGNRNLRLEIPRCSAYHCREINKKRRSLILIRNYGPTSLLREPGSKYPQYEIVCQRIDKNPETMLFGREVTDVCYNILKESQKSIVWQKQGTKLCRIEGISFAHKWQKKLGPSLVSQLIDPAGYTRIINFAHEVGTVSIIVPPSQPLNCPVQKTLKMIKPERAIEIFGKPSGCSVSEGKVRGLWFPYLGLQDGFFCPTTDLKPNIYPVIATDPFQELLSRKSPINDIIDLQNQASIIKQLIMWMFILSGYQDVDRFVDKYFKSGFSTTASYDFSNLSSILPDLSTVKECIAHVEKYAPSFVRDGKLYFKSSTLYERVCYFLKKYDVDHKPSERVRIARLNFIQKSSTNNQGLVKVFTSRSDFENWIDDMEENHGKILQVHKKFTKQTYYKKLPYVVKIPDGYFLVKNLPENSRQVDAEKYGGNWIEQGVFDGKTTPENKYPVMQYVVSSTQEAEHYTSTTDIEEGKPFTRILVYGNSQEITDTREAHSYATLLPLSYSPGATDDVTA